MEDVSSVPDSSELKHVSFKPLSRRVLLSRATQQHFLQTIPSRIKSRPKINACKAFAETALVSLLVRLLQRQR